MNEDRNDEILMKEYRSDNESNERQNGKDEENTRLMSKIEPFSPMQDINKAFEGCKFGRFHIKLLIATFVGMHAAILVTNTTAYLLPIAECDLDMNLKEKGLLQAMPYIGMFFSSVISGFLIDTFGRKLFLKIGYGGLFLFVLLSAASQNYVMFAAAKLGEGFFSAIAIGGIQSILSEFCHPSVRDRVMLCQSSFAAMAQILCPAVSWIILVQKWEWSLFNGAFQLKIWNFYLLIMSLCSLCSCLMYASLPESPKFLVTQKRYLKARNVLIKVYTENTRKSADTFPHLSLWDKEITEQAKEKDISLKKDVFKEFKTQVLVGLQNVKPLMERPLLYYLIIISVMQTFIVSMYNVLRLWFPQLSTIVEHYKLDGNQNLCELLDNYTAAEKMRVSNATFNSTDVCVPHVSGAETYINSMIIGLVCMVPYFISGVIVNKVGKKCLLVLAGIISTGSLLGIRWSISKTMLVAFYSTNVATTQTMKSLTQVVLVEVFPTTMRSFAMSIMMSLARANSLAGNIGFPILLSMGCAIPFYTMTGITIGLIVLAMFTPKKKES